MGYVGTNKVHADWYLYEQYISQQWLRIMQNDAISFSHPISIPIERDEQIIGIFDSITYSKGSSLVRMMYQCMTENTLNRGVSKYLKSHLYSTVEKTDLWNSLNEQMIEDNISLPRNTSISDIMSTWIDQMGYPYVQVTRDYLTNTISVMQHQFLFDSKAQPPKSPYNYRWYIPFQFKSLSESSLSNIVWFNEEKINLTIDSSIQLNDWILANPNLLGFFRTNYDQQNWQMIIQQLKTNHSIFSTVERAGLIDDLFNLARASMYCCLLNRRALLVVFHF